MFVTLLRFATKEIMFRPIPLIIDIDIYSYFCPSKTNRNKYETDSYDVVCFGIYAFAMPAACASDCDIGAD